MGKVTLIGMTFAGVCFGIAGGIEVAKLNLPPAAKLTPLCPFILDEVVSSINILPDQTVQCLYIKAYGSAVKRREGKLAPLANAR